LLLVLSRKRKNLSSPIYMNGQYLLYCGVSALQSVLNLISLIVICFSSLLTIQMTSTGSTFFKHLHHFFFYIQMTGGEVFVYLSFFFFLSWEAGQVLARKLMLSLVVDFQQGKPLVLNPKFVQGLRSILCDSSLDKVQPVYFPHPPPPFCGVQGGGRKFVH